MNLSLRTRPASGLSNAPGALDQAAAANKLALDLLAKHGGVSLRSNGLFAGMLCLDGDTSIVDAVKEETGFGCTIFCRNVRVATTAVAAGGTERALGTEANLLVSRQVFGRGQRFQGITRTIGKDWVIIYDPLRDHTRRVVGMIATYRELDDYLTDLSRLGNCPEAVLIHTEGGRVLDASRAASDILGLSRASLLARSMRQLWSVRGNTINWPRIDEEPVILEQTWTRADGFEFPMQLSIQRTSVGGSYRQVLLTIARDFSHEAAAKERVLDANHKLESRIEELETALKKARDELSKVDRIRAEARSELGAQFTGISRHLDQNLSVLAKSLEPPPNKWTPAPDPRTVRDQLESVRRIAGRIIALANNGPGLDSEPDPQALVASAPTPAPLSRGTQNRPGHS